MKVDLSVPAIRELVENFSSTIKSFRDKVKKLQTKNKALQAELLHTRVIAYDSIMEQYGCSWERADEIFKAQMRQRFCNNETGNSATAN